MENITYLCTKVNIENETAVSAGCYRQMKNGHELELCLCESSAGRTPCNEAVSSMCDFTLMLKVFFFAAVFIGFVRV